MTDLITVYFWMTAIFLYFYVLPPLIGFSALVVIGLLVHSIIRDSREKARYRRLVFAVLVLSGIALASTINVISYQKKASDAALPKIESSYASGYDRPFDYCLERVGTTSCRNHDMLVNTEALKRQAVRPWLDYTALLEPQSALAIYLTSNTTRKVLNNAEHVTFSVIVSGVGRWKVAECTLPVLPNPHWLTAINIGYHFSQSKAGGFFAACKRKIWTQSRVQFKSAAPKNKV